MSSPLRRVPIWAIVSAAWFGPAILAAFDVTVRFEGRGAATDVIVTHSSIATETLRDQHEHGCVGCLDGLAGGAERSHSAGDA